jgi:hypothetical protein
MDMSSSAGSHAGSPAYKPPRLVILGSVAELTLGNTGSFVDNNGRGKKKNKK